ncbi:alginate lyase family protein [Chitinophaga tropicalis]|uniref:Alginate lyase n=1 Tax=Chitinophaga tropicalis TaxID=2683588 RepID=A0A7K1U6L6_9BACT|nr:alginate lyase family protein [Chitinophaga tropicalis]MVT09615.1 alginate lyase [Chitinophaga tropicalis]
MIRSTLIFITLLFVSLTPPRKEVINVLRRQVLAEAELAMKQQPITVTAAISPRSAGGKHDFYSEGDYWWPNPAHPDSPYVQRDGLSNPANFIAHRLAMIRFSRIIGALASAYKITGDERYVKVALKHLHAWFIDPATLMHPSLQYAQAIKGRFTGRGIGIIDTIQLMEVVQGVSAMKDAKIFDKALLAGVRKWFADYLAWLTSHPYGKDEMNAKNNHGTCWVMQVACFAKLTNNDTLLQFCRDRYKQVLLPNQMAADGSFPLELARTKPYGYSLFNLDAMVTICQLLPDLWEFELPDGRCIKKGIQFMYPYVANKNGWPHKKDVMYWEEWPVAHPFLLFGAEQYKQADWFNTWKRLEHRPETGEVIRNLPVRNPLIWL